MTVTDHKLGVIFILELDEFLKLTVTEEREVTYPQQTKPTLVVPVPNPEFGGETTTQSDSLASCTYTIKSTVAPGDILNRVISNVERVILNWSSLDADRAAYSGDTADSTQHPTVVAKQVSSSSNSVLPLTQL
jgi:hypothetical protein